MGLKQLYRFGLIGNTSLRQFKKNEKTSFVLTPINVKIDFDVRV